MDLTVKDVFNKASIKKRAMENWNYKTEVVRQKHGRKYNHIFEKHKLKKNDWSLSFDYLSVAQQNVLIKSEIIRTYDSLPNIDKSYIKKNLSLSMFASKWYKLCAKDKLKILNYIIN